MFYTQITMEAAEDPEFLKAMGRARILGAIVGVEAVTADGLKTYTSSGRVMGKPAHRLFAAEPMPDLEVPAP